MPHHARRTLLALMIVLGSSATWSRPAVACQPNTVPGTMALVGGTLIDGNGATPVQNSVVLISDGRISAVGRVGQLRVPVGATVVNAIGMTLLPGLFDSHVHLMLVGHGNYAHWDSVYPARLAADVNFDQFRVFA